MVGVMRNGTYLDNKGTIINRGGDFLEKCYESRVTKSRYY